MCKINGKKLSEIRIEKGISRMELASRIGLSKSSIQKYETGVANPSDKVADKICMILKINKKDIEVHDIGYNFMDNTSKTVEYVRKQKGFIRYLTPTETEKWVHNHCEFDEKTAKCKIQTALNNSFGIAKKKYILLDPTLVHIPDWQRDTDMAKTIEIAENYNENKFDPIKIYIHDGILDVADGAHRLVAIIRKNEEAKKKDEPLMQAQMEITECNEHEAILTFLGQQSGRKTMSVADTYRAGVKANIKEYIDFKNLFEGYNIQITSEMHKLKNPIGVINPSGEALRLVERDRETLIKVLDLIIKLDWCGAKKNVFVIRNLKALQSLYATYGDEIEEKLLKNCKGAVYFESKISCITSKAELYDILSAEINK